MDFKFGKDADNSAGTKQSASGEKNRQTALLLVLLALVGGGGYLYFFTDLIKPQTEQKPAEAPAPQAVRKPLPTGNAPAAAPDKKDGVALPAAVAQAVPAAQPVKEQPKAAPEAAKAPVAKPQPAADVKAQKPAEPVKPAAAKPAAAKTAAEQKAPAAGDKKAVTADKKSAESAEPKNKAAVKPATAANPAVIPAKSVKVAKTARKPAAVAAKESGGPWTVNVGNYMLEDAMAADLAKVRKAGLQAAVKPGARKKTAMHRLFLAEYPDRASAQASLDKLKKNTSDAFILGQGGKYAVYAGSYLLDSRAASEKDRLAAAGYVLTMKSAEVAIQSKSLTAGTFQDKKAAESVAAKLQAAGLKTTLQH